MKNKILVIECSVFNSNFDILNKYQNIYDKVHIFLNSHEDRLKLKSLIFLQKFIKNNFILFHDAIPDLENRIFFYELGRVTSNLIAGDEVDFNFKNLVDLHLIIEILESKSIKTFVYNKNRKEVNINNLIAISEHDTPIGLTPNQHECELLLDDMVESFNSLSIIDELDCSNLDKFDDVVEINKTTKTKKKLKKNNNALLNKSNNEVQVCNPSFNANNDFNVNIFLENESKNELNEQELIDQQELIKNQEKNESNKSSLKNQLSELIENNGIVKISDESYQEELIEILEFQESISPNYDSMITEINDQESKENQNFGMIPKLEDLILITQLDSFSIDLYLKHFGVSTPQTKDILRSLVNSFNTYCKKINYQKIKFFEVELAVKNSGEYFLIFLYISSNILLFLKPLKLDGYRSMLFNRMRIKYKDSERLSEFFLRYFIDIGMVGLCYQNRINSRFKIRHDPLLELTKKLENYVDPSIIEYCKKMDKWYRKKESLTHVTNY